MGSCKKPLAEVLLKLSTLGKIFSNFHRKQDLTFHANWRQFTGFDFSCKLLETICMKIQILFSGKNKKNITYLMSAELAQKMVTVNENPLHVSYVSTKTCCGYSLEVP